MTWKNCRINSLGAKVQGSESSWEQNLTVKVPGPSESSQELSTRERKFRERTGQGPIETFAPGSELARERKGCDSCIHRL